MTFFTHRFRSFRTTNCNGGPLIKCKAHRQKIRLVALEEMSRQRWMNTAGRPRPDWRVAFSHTPLKGRTTDPEALDWDEASEIFLSGVRCARRGDLEAGRAQIATAFLLDGRSINYCTVLPAPEAADLALDDELLRMLILSDPNSFASTVLNILAARCYGHADKHGQAVIGIAMRSIEFLIKACEQNPTLEKTPNEGGPLGGCLSRPNLLFLRSALHMPMGNHKLAIRDLTAALKINPNYTPARDARASLYATLKRKDNITIHGEYQRIIREVHEDQRGNEVSYAWLAITTLEEPRLGTLDDAKRYYEKSIRATARRDELYGPRRSDELPPCLEVMKQKMAMMGSAPAMERLRRDFDRARWLCRYGKQWAGQAIETRVFELWQECNR
jgi:tetratricopeptide (TPR) repeat protein